MALPKRGTRRITVEGIEYRWLVSFNDTGLTIIVERAASPGQQMATGGEHGDIVTPGHVRKAILQALDKGWNPQSPAAIFGLPMEKIAPRDNDLGHLLLRRYREKDSRDVWCLHNLISEQTGAYRGEKRWNNDLNEISDIYQNSGGEFIVGYLENQLVTMGGFQRISSNQAKIRRIEVHPDFQQLGCGQRLLEYLETQAVRLGYTTLTLQATSIQIAAQQLYISNGYVELSRSPWHGMERIYFEKRFL
ncbi:MAG TPA: GNAT family N-acetyltransferase [Coleofasciculaceae cyanobacterium]|jgi:ribosomal protein S18 acetylase RimI-like enzyme